MFNAYDDVAREAAHDYDPEPDYDRPTLGELMLDAAEARARMAARFPAPNTDGTFSRRTDLHIPVDPDADLPF